MLFRTLKKIVLELDYLKFLTLRKHISLGLISIDGLGAFLVAFSNTLEMSVENNEFVDHVLF